MTFDWTILTSLISVLCGSGTVVTYALYRKQQKRYKIAEAFEKEVVALKATVETMQTQLRFYDERLSEMQKLVVGKDAYISQLSQDKHLLEVKNARNKSAINKAHGCGHCANVSDCPVLRQKTANEDDYLKQLNRGMGN